MTTAAAQLARRQNVTVPVAAPRVLTARLVPSVFDPDPYECAAWLQRALAGHGLRGSLVYVHQDLLWYGPDHGYARGPGVRAEIAATDDRTRDDWVRSVTHLARAAGLAGSVGGH